MFELGIVDLSASARRRLAALVERWAWVSPESRIATPRISIHLLSPEEVRFHGSLDVCVVGPELVGCDAAYITTLRRELTDKLIICVLDARTQSFGVIEQLGRLGVDDVLLETATGDEFLRRLVLLQRRLRSRQRGRVVMVDAARGGVGCTFIAAALAEGCADQKKRTCVVDCDYLSQDLTRFLQVKPFVSEALRLLVEQQRMVTGETVSDCVHSVWADEPLLHCMPPPAGSDDGTLAPAVATRAFIDIIETLAVLHERVIVDASSLSAGVKRALYYASDLVVFVANRDPAAAFANRQALSLVSASMRVDSQLHVVLNDCGRPAASRALLERDVLSVLGRSRQCVYLPHSTRAARWACSGRTPFAFLRRHFLPLLHASTADDAASRGTVGMGVRAWCDVVGRIVARLLSWRRKKEMPLEAESNCGRGDTSYEPLSLGFTENLLTQGELVSKPVLLG